MKRVVCLLVYTVCFLLPAKTMAGDTLIFQGQASGLVNINPTIGTSVWMGARYIPTLDYKIELPKSSLMDFEASANINGSVGFNSHDSVSFDGKIAPYRLWARYSTSQLEIRLGLQKINFGSATLLRPLMWFDQVDPRDPLQFTNGVWAILARYYFLNNANIWLWGLYGNHETKSWEIAKTSDKIPEFGGRVQVPVLKGDAAVSFHFRQADTWGLIDSMPGNANTPEQRVGLDGKWDIGPGIWFEGSWIHKSYNTGNFTNQEIFTVGTDYTFGLGNGLNVVFEHMLYGYGLDAFDFGERLSLSGMTFSYPLNMNNQVYAVFYHDWTNNNFYNFVNWKHRFNKLDFYLNAYWNPEKYLFPLQNEKNNLAAGKGIQIMVVFNH